MKRIFTYSVSLLFTLLLSVQLIRTQPIIADHFYIDRLQVPTNWIDSARAKLIIAYGHTSHGSQLVTGMSALLQVHGSLYNFNSNGSNGALNFRNTPFSGASDLGNPNRTAWEASTRNYLNSHPEVNVIIWSWCGQVGGAESDIQLYLDLMTGLEEDYSGVKFVYMTGHLDGTAATGTVNLRNEQIRTYCQNNGKILFDFADIESYDPDALVNYMQIRANDNCDYDSDGNGSRDSNWATNWISANPGSEFTQEAATICSTCCAHSKGLNCSMKGRAVWWLWARLAGWNGTETAPWLAVSPKSLSFANTIVDSTSEAKSYTIAGSNLIPETDTLIISAPDRFSVSTEINSNFGQLLEIVYIDGMLQTKTIYVKFCPAEVKDYTGSIMISGGGASIQSVSVAGSGVEVITPLLIADPEALSFSEVPINTVSQEMVYTLTGSDLIPADGGNIITAPEGYEVSLTSETDYSSSITFPYSGGILSSTTIYVRFAPTYEKDYNGDIINTGGGAEPENVYVSGTGISASDVNEDYAFRTFKLCQNYPNPFNPRTVISYKLKVNSKIVLKIYDLLGHEIITLIDGMKPQGEHTVEWNAQNYPSGIYLCKLQAGLFIQTIKLILLK